MTPQTTSTLMRPRIAVGDQATSASVRRLIAWTHMQRDILMSPQGAWGRLTETVLNTLLDSEMDLHLGYRRGRHVAKANDNERNGYRLKPLETDVGHLVLRMPRDRKGTFQPQIIRKRLRQLDNTQDLVLPLMAHGLSAGEAAACISEAYNVDVSEELVKAFRDKLADEITYWRNSRLHNTYPAIFVDVLHRRHSAVNKTFLMTVAFSKTGHHNVLGIWATDNDEYRMRQWRSKLMELKERGLTDVPIVLHNTFRGMSEIAKQVWKTTNPQTCTSHLYQKTTLVTGLF